MGKIVKYCAACDESFAEKFGFCPNCGQAMTAFEMNPIGKELKVAEETKTAAIVSEPPVETAAPIVVQTAPAVEPTPVVEPAPVSETVAVSAVQTQGFSEEVKAAIIDDNDDEAEPEFVPPTVTKTFAAAAGANGNGNGNHQTAVYNFQDAAAVKPDVGNDGGYRITVIEEKNSKQRNLLLLGALALMLTLTLGGTVYSLFNKDLMVGAINEEGGIFVPIVDEEPAEIEEQPKPKTDKDAGGGGGGGREEPEKASQGRLVNQSENPIDTPNARIPQLTNPALQVNPETKGNIKRERTEQPPGLPGSDNLNPSNGTGRGGGIGSGSGTGIGGGDGTGEGNGNGSGSGNGNGNGNGDGRGDGNQGDGSRRTPPPPPVVKPVGVTQAINITYKPQPKYTDAARQNNVSGTVSLKVTFTSSGQIGNVAPVSGLPYGLTEQAISAARQIKFDPPKKNGVPYSVTRTIAYTFTIY